MAEIVKTVRIETGNGERSVKSLKKEISDLRDALLNMDQGGEEWVKTANELTRAQEELNTVMKAGKQAVDADASSIAGMEARYKSLYTTYRLLSDEQRKSAKGLSMQKELAELSENLNTVKKDAGNFKDNIGHYADDMMSAFSSLGINIGGLQGPFKLASQGAKGFKGALDILAKHPFLTVAVVLIGLFKKINDAIKGNEELQMRMNKVMAAFKPIGDAVAQALDKIASLAVSVAEGIAKVVTWFTNLLGITRDLNEAEQNLADTENELNKKRRQYAEENAKDTNRIEQLREEASETDNVKEKLEKLTEAKKLQEEVNKRNVELAKQELEYLEEQAKVRPNSKEDNDKISQAKVNVENVEAAGAKAVRTLNKGIQSARSAANKAAEDTKKQVSEILKRLEDSNKTEIQKLKEKYAEEKALLIKHHKDTAKLEEEFQNNLRSLEATQAAIRTKQWIQVREMIVDRYIQPSTKAYEEMLTLAEDKTKKFLLTIKEMMGGTLEATFSMKDAPKFAQEWINGNWEALRTEGGKLSQKLQELNETWNLGITEDMKDEDIVSRINSFYASLKKGIQNVQIEQKNWNAEIEQTKREIEHFRETTEKYPFWDYLLGEDDNWDAYAKKLGDIEATERKFVEERANRAEENWHRVENLSENELNELGITLNEKYEMEREYYEALEELRQHYFQGTLAYHERDKELDEQKIESLHELKMQYFDSINSIVDTYKVLLDAYKRDGEMSEKEAKKKANTLKWLEGIQGAAAVAQIVADTASGWMQLNKSQAAEYVLNAETAAATGPAAAATKAALDAKTTLVHGIRKATLIAGGVTAAAAAIGKTIASIKSLDKGSGDEGGSSAAAAPQLIDSTPYSYTRELQTDVEREQVLNTPIYVRVTDIESAQARVRVTDRESTY